MIITKKQYEHAYKKLSSEAFKSIIEKGWKGYNIKWIDKSTVDIDMGEVTKKALFQNLESANETNKILVKRLQEVKLELLAIQMYSIRDLEESVIDALKIIDGLPIEERGEDGKTFF